jgi:hypothetical protein
VGTRMRPWIVALGVAALVALVPAAAAAVDLTGEIATLDSLDDATEATDSLLGTVKETLDDNDDEDEPPLPGDGDEGDDPKPSDDGSGDDAPAERSSDRESPEQQRAGPVVSAGSLITFEAVTTRRASASPHLTFRSEPAVSESDDSEESPLVAAPLVTASEVEEIEDGDIVALGVPPHAPDAGIAAEVLLATALLVIATIAQLAVVASTESPSRRVTRAP